MSTEARRAKQCRLQLARRTATRRGGSSWSTANQQLKSPSGERQLIAVLSMLNSPERGTSLFMGDWNHASRLLTGESLLERGPVANGPEMAPCLAFAEKVKQALDDAGWRPSDMINVQSFLRVMAQRPESNGPESRAVEAIGEQIAAQGMLIDDRAQRRYQYGLQSRGFVIVAGPGRAGKTWLTELCPNAVQARCTLAPVAPNYTYRDAIRDSFGKRAVTYAGIVHPGAGRGYSGELGAIPGVPGQASPAAAVRNVVRSAIRSTGNQPSEST